MWILPFNLKTKTEQEELIGIGNLAYDNRPLKMWYVRVTVTKPTIVKLYIVNKDKIEGGEIATDMVAKTRSEIKTTSSEVLIRPQVSEKDLLKVYKIDSGDIHTLLSENDGMRLPGEFYIFLSAESEKDDGDDEGRIMGEFVWEEITPVK